MSGQPKQKPNLKSAAVRWQICREVRVPDHYMTRAGKRINVPVHITKTVLTDLAQLAWPGNPNFKGIGNIAHGTGLPSRSIDKGIAVLRAAGILNRIPRGMKQTKLTALNWELMETLREPFRKVAEPEEDAPDDLDDELAALKADDDVSSLGPVATGGAQADLVDLFMEFGPYHNLRPAIETVIKGLLKDKTPEEIRTAWNGMEKWQKMKAVKAKNPGGYLRTTLMNAIDQPQQEPALEDDYDWDEANMDEVMKIVRSDGGANISLSGFDDDKAQSLVRWAKKWCEKNAPEVEYEVDLANERILIFAGAPTR